MTKAAAIYKFWSSFGIAAYEENNVPTGSDAPSFPYITYSFASDRVDTQILLSASIWDRSSSWVDINAKAEEIGRRIDEMGTLVCDEGRIYITRGAPFAQNMRDPEDPLVKRKYLNIVVEYFTAH